MKIYVKRKDGTKRTVTIMFDRNTNKYCFVNMTTKHVCKCRFTTINEAIFDLVSDKNVVSFTYIK